MKKLFMHQQKEIVESLPCWRGETIISTLSGGMTNHNYLVENAGMKYVVRLGDDMPEHLLFRENEGVTSEVAGRVGFGPEVVHRQPGILVIRFIEGRVLSEEDVRGDHYQSMLVDLLQRFHQQMPTHFDGFPMLFWVFQTLRHYRSMLDQSNTSYREWLPEMTTIAAQLEAAVGQIDLVYCHNDLLAANLIDDGQKLWLIDYDYAAFNSPLFDLSNLASNSMFEPAAEKSLLESYFQENLSEQRWQSYSAMKCASLLRELVWSMVSEEYSKVEFDYASYTREFRGRFDAVYNTYLDNL